MYNVNYTTSYAFNLAGEVTTMTYPSGRVVKHEYDAIGRVQNVKNNATQANYATGAAYNTAGQITGFSYGNGVTAAMGYSAQRLQLASLSYAQGGTTHLSLAYGYSQGGNNNGQIASVTDSSGETGAAGRTVNYTYDSLHRLLTAQTTGSAQYPQWGLSWTGVYPERVRHSRTSRRNRFGNRSAQTVTAGSGPSNSVTIDAATNRITAMGGFTFYYDANGNLTQDDLYKYKYDAENRMVEVRLLNNTLVSTYAFDGKSLRISKVVGADRTMYVYAGTEMISEYEDAASNTYSPGTTPGQAGSDSTATILYQHGDHLTTRVTTENNGDLSNRQGHYPYGESWYEALTANPSVLRKYTTYLRDDETTSGKLNYAVFRQHSARTGRFLMADSVRGRVRIPQRLNRFAYVMNNPVSRRDPAGLDEEFGGPSIAAPGSTPGWPDWGVSELDRCLDPTSPLCGNSAFWHSISPLISEPSRPASSFDRYVGLANAVLDFVGGFLPDWFPPFGTSSADCQWGMRAEDRQINCSSVRGNDTAELKFRVVTPGQTLSISEVKIGNVSGLVNGYGTPYPVAPGENYHHQWNVNFLWDTNPGGSGAIKTKGEIKWVVKAKCGGLIEETRDITATIQCSN